MCVVCFKKMVWVQGLSMFLSLLSIYYCEATQRSSDGRTVLPLGALAARGETTDFADQIPALQLAVDIINNDTSLLKDYYLQLHVKISPCTGTDAIRDFFDLTGNSRENSSFNPFMFIFGGGCSPRSEGISEVAPFMNILVVDHIATSAVLSDHNRFPNFFRIEYVETANHLAQAYYIRNLNYASQRVGILLQEERIFTINWEMIERVYTSAGIRTTVVRFTDKSLETLVDQLFNDPPAMFVINAYEGLARRVFCKAVERGLVYPRSGWVLPGWFGNGWWNVSIHEDRCPNSVIEKFVESTISVLTVAREDNIDKQTDVNLTLREFVEKFEEYFYQSSFINPNISNPRRHPYYNNYGYDVVWVVARAMNQSIPLLEAEGFNLESFNYFKQGEKILQIVRSQLKQTNFTGLSGPIAFQNGSGNRIEIPTVLSIHRKNEKGELYVVDIGLVKGDQVALTINKDDIYPGEIPRLNLTEPDPVLYWFLVITAMIATAISIFFICFTIACRKKKRIRATSPIFNIITATGSILFYVTVPIMFAPFKTPEEHDLRCQLDLWSPSIGYLFITFPLLLKTCRVYYIFHYPSINSKALRDWKLLLVFLITLVLVTIMALIFTVVPDIKTAPQEVYIIKELRIFCRGGNVIPAYIMISIFFGIILLIGSILSFQTRNIRIKAFRESRQISAAFLLLTLSGVLIWPLYFFATIPLNVLTALVGLSIIVSTAISMCIIFLPTVYLIIIKKDDDIDSTWTQEEDLASLHRLTISSLQQEVNHLSNKVKDLSTKISVSNIQTQGGHRTGNKLAHILFRKRAATDNPIGSTSKAYYEVAEL